MTQQHTETQSHAVKDIVEFRALCAKLSLPIEGWERRGDVLVNNAWDLKRGVIVRHLVTLKPE